MKLLNTLNKKLELWQVSGKGDLSIRRLSDVADLEEALAAAKREGKGKYHVCDKEGNLAIFKIIRIPASAPVLNLVTAN